MAGELKIPIIWHDEHILVINKPAGLLATQDGYNLSAPHVRTVLSPQYEPLWIVHRLDRYTSGVMILARSTAAHRNLNTQFQERQVRKVYLALIKGDPAWETIFVDHPLSTNKGRRHRTMIDLQGGKPSVTRFEVLQRYDKYTQVKAAPETGRRHQIRAHLASLGHPVACDSLYGGEKSLSHADIAHKLPDAPHSDETLLKRPGLHASVLELKHPATNQRVVYEAPFPQDLQRTVDVLKDRLG